MLCALLALAGCTVAPSKPDAPAAATDSAAAAAKLEQDLLAQMLAGEFALGQADLAEAAQRYAKAARLSKDAQVAAQATRLALAARNWSLAREMVARWRSLKTDDPGLLQADASLAMADGHPDLAFDALQRLLRLPDNHGWRFLGQVILGASDKQMAATLLERLASPLTLATAPEETWVAMSQLAFKLERKAYARSLADAAVQRFASGMTYAWSAQLAADEGDKARAAQQYLEAIKRSPKDIRLRAAYALLLGEQGDNKAAAQILAEGPQDDYTYAARAAYTARSQDKALMQALYGELEALPPEQQVARADLLGQLAELLERRDAALAWYQQVTPDSENWFDSQMRIAVLLDQQGKHEAAANLIHELQARSGDEPKSQADAFLLEAELRQRGEQAEAAMEVYDRALKTLPDETRLLYGRALLAASIGQMDQSEQDLRRVLSLKPDDADAMNALGYTLADGNRKLDEAQALIEKALAAKPDEPAVIDSLGWVNFRRGKLDEAEKNLRRAFDKQPDAEIAAHLGEVLWSQGKRDEAKAVFEKGRKADAKSKALLDTLKRLGL